MHSKVSSDCLPSYIKATRPVLEIFKMAGYFPDRPRILLLSPTVWINRSHFWLSSGILIQGCCEVLSRTSKETSYSDRRFWVIYFQFIIVIGGILVLYIYIYITRFASNEIFSPSNKIHREVGLYRVADKSLARPAWQQATATEDFEFHISYL